MKTPTTTTDTKAPTTDTKAPTTYTNAPTTDTKQNGRAMQDEKTDRVTSGPMQEQKAVEVQHQPQPPTSTAQPQPPTSTAQPQPPTSNTQPQPTASAAPVATSKVVATSGAILEIAAASVSSALESAKEVIYKD